MKKNRIKLENGFGYIKNGLLVITCIKVDSNDYSVSRINYKTRETIIKTGGLNLINYFVKDYNIEFCE